MFKEFDKIVWIRQIEPQSDDRVGVCGHSGRICRVTSFIDCEPHLQLPVDRTPLKIENGQCNCAKWCMDINCELNEFSPEEFWKHYDIDSKKYHWYTDFGSKTFYFNYKSVNLIDLMKVLAFPIFPQEYQNSMYEIFEEGE